MNNPSPFGPQNSLAEQKNKARARVKLAVYFILAINGVGLMALLMQGCRQEKPAPEPEINTNAPAETNVAPPAPDTNAPAAAATSNATQVVEPTPPPQPPTPPPPAVSDYTVVSGDTLGGIAKKNHVSLKALEEANSGVEPTKLKIGQKLHVPAPSTAPSASAAPAPDAAAGGEQLYTVKSGDNLLKIAGLTGASVKAIRAANNLKTDKIVVGQKLKIPAKAAAAAPAPATPTETAPPPPAASSTPTTPSGH